jgi:16S rRNA (adenine1518-N6/adenine1519-N6)-dimethyltransferase
VSVNRQLVQKARDLRLKRGLSQNFLVDDAVLAKIAQASIENSDRSVPIVEIGPGAGFLTQYLVQSEHPVTAVEIDRKMIPVLTEAFGAQPNFQLLHQDILKTDIETLLAPRGIIVGNIPYHLTGPILFRITGELYDQDYPLRNQLEHVVLMVQKEVGDRLTAKPGDTAYSQLTLQAQFWFEVTPVVFAPQQAFYPSPKVDSQVVHLKPRSAPAAAVDDLAFFSKLIKNCFMHRRKIISKNLKLGGYGNDEKLSPILAKLGIPPLARAQELSIEQFGALSNALTACR